MNQKNTCRSDGANDTAWRVMVQPWSLAAAPIALWRTVMPSQSDAVAAIMTPAKTAKRGVIDIRTRLGLGSVLEIMLNSLIVANFSEP